MFVVHGHQYLVTNFPKGNKTRSDEGRQMASGYIYVCVCLWYLVLQTREQITMKTTVKLLYNTLKQDQPFFSRWHDRENPQNSAGKLKMQLIKLYRKAYSCLPTMGHFSIACLPLDARYKNDYSSLEIK